MKVAKNEYLDFWVTIPKALELLNNLHVDHETELIVYDFFIDQLHIVSNS